MTETSRETGPGRKHREGVKMGKAKIMQFGKLENSGWWEDICQA